MAWNTAAPTSAALVNQYVEAINERRRVFGLPAAEITPVPAASHWVGQYGHEIINPGSNWTGGAAGPFNWWLIQLWIEQLANSFVENRDHSGEPELLNFTASHNVGQDNDEFLGTFWDKFAAEYGYRGWRAETEATQVAAPRYHRFIRPGDIGQASYIYEDLRRALALLTAVRVDADDWFVPPEETEYAKEGIGYSPQQPEPPGSGSIAAAEGRAEADWVDETPGYESSVSWPPMQMAAATWYKVPKEDGGWWDGYQGYLLSVHAYSKLSNLTAVSAPKVIDWYAFATVNQWIQGWLPEGEFEKVEFGTTGFTGLVNNAWGKWATTPATTATEVDSERLGPDPNEHPGWGTDPQRPDPGSGDPNWTSVRGWRIPEDSQDGDGIVNAVCVLKYQFAYA